MIKNVMHWLVILALILLNFNGNFVLAETAEKIPPPDWVYGVRAEKIPPPDWVYGVRNSVKLNAWFTHESSATTINNSLVIEQVLAEVAKNDELSKQDIHRLAQKVALALAGITDQQYLNEDKEESYPNTNKAYGISFPRDDEGRSSNGQSAPLAISEANDGDISRIMVGSSGLFSAISSAFKELSSKQNSQLFWRLGSVAVIVVGTVVIVIGSGGTAFLASGLACGVVGLFTHPMSENSVESSINAGFDVLELPCN